MLSAYVPARPRRWQCSLDASGRGTGGQVAFGLHLRRHLLPALRHLDIDVSLRDRWARWRRSLWFCCRRRLGLLPAASNHNSALPFQPQVAIYDGSVAAGEHWHLEAELADRGAHPIHCGIVLARVANVENEALYRPDLDLQRLCRGLRKHASPSDTSRVEVPFGGCALRWPVEPSL